LTIAQRVPHHPARDRIRERDGDARAAPLDADLTDSASGGRRSHPRAHKPR
jgi:hypothetical protein